MAQVFLYDALERAVQLRLVDIVGVAMDMLEAAMDTPGAELDTQGAEMDTPEAGLDISEAELVQDAHDDDHAVLDAPLVEPFP
ncbi:hypothetical protein ANCDUO_09509 [Ancylostoma duodenale]|uniref:Uncharacterized protein n=1 Tax=Ancylostoma duodenale TaxID=51022 RepID=A0A0C2DCS5_9BILA|nr:hypothetical protein ANCDUO_09509 [Ancylostoma duodenale]